MIHFEVEGCKTVYERIQPGDVFEKVRLAGVIGVAVRIGQGVGRRSEILHEPGITDDRVGVRSGHGDNGESGRTR